MIGNQFLHCLGVLLGAREAATQLSAVETARLVELATTSKQVVEIGVFEGATSRRLIARMPAGGRIYCVDPFFPGRLGVAYGLWITRSQVRRARRRDVECQIVRRLSHDFAPTAPADLDLVFIDGDHRYEAVQRDWADWSAKVKVGGAIALHDSVVIPGRCKESSGPVMLVKQLGRKPPGFEMTDAVDTLTVYRRLS